MRVSFKVRKYKCFGEEYQGFDTIKKFNIIIGKNNSGKSKLLEALEYFIKNGIQSSYIPDIQIGNTFTKEQLIRIFADNISSGTLGNVLGNMGSFTASNCLIISTTSCGALKILLIF